MRVPDEFKDFCIPFDPDICDQDEGRYLPGEDVISFAVRQVNDRQKRVVKDFVDKILRASLSDQELADIWAQGHSRIGFVDEQDYRRIFEEIRRRLV